MEKEKLKKHYTGTTNNDVMDWEVEHRAIARKAASEGMVLLKNEAVLPLEKGSKIALYGAGARHTIKGGTGSGDVNVRHNVNVEEGLLQAGFQITTQSWLSDYDAEYAKAREAWKQTLIRVGEERKIGLGGAYFEEPAFRAPAGRKINNEDIAKSDTDIAILVLTRTAGEGRDRHVEEGDYLLSATEKQQIKTISQYYRKTLLVINTGGQVDLAVLRKYPVKAILYMVQAGMEGGNALADLVSGTVTPSGKLTATWAEHYKDYPNAMNYSHCNNNVIEERYEEGIYVGYRYFDSFQVKPAYAFGFGLSYTEFTIRTESVEVKEGRCYLKIHVENTGSQYEGREVVQIYVSCPQKKMKKEYQRLVTFGKTKVLKPGEEEVLELSFNLKHLSSYVTGQAAYFMEQGEYILRVGNASDHTEIAAVLDLERNVYTEYVKNICPLHTFLKEIQPEYTFETRLPEHVLKIKLKESDIRRQSTPLVEGMDNEYQKRAKAIISRMEPEEMAELVCGAQERNSGSIAGIASSSVPGAAGETTTTLLEKYDLPSIVLADGPAGVRISDRYQVNPKDGSIYPQDFFATVEEGFLMTEPWKEDATDYYQHCSAIPVGTLLAQSFDRELLFTVGRMIGQEMKKYEVTLWLAPGMNIQKNPLCGRNFEYYSEDPYVSGTMAGAITNGVQSVGGVGTTIKHFACNNQEDNRRGSNSIVSERTLRELYLKGFEIAIKGSDPMAIMTSYNCINGIHTANSADLCQEAARAEWGFSGVIMTDWCTTNGGGGSSAAKCITAGNDLVMPGAESDKREILEALDGTNGQNLDIHDLRRCAQNIVALILQSNRCKS